MGDKSLGVDLAKLTRSGILCLEELVQIAVLSSEAEVPTDWLVVTCTTCIESHFDRMLNSLISISDIEANRFASSLYQHGHDDIFKTWDSRLKWLDNGFGVAIAGDSSIQDFRTLVEVRNAIVHGQGHLTEIQQKNIQKLLDLKRRLTRLLDVQFSGHKVLLPAAIGPRIFRICRSAVVCLDTSVLKFYPAIRT